MHLPTQRWLAALAVLGATACTSSDGSVRAPASDVSESTAVDEPTPSASSSDDGTPVEVEVQRAFDALPPIHPSVDGYGEGEVVLRGPDGAVRWEVPVLVADDNQERQHGLMEVPSMPDGTGMAFLWEDEADRSGAFWMFGTLMDIDIVYVAADGSSSGHLTMVPCEERPCPTYPPRAPYRFAVEFPGGWLDRIGFDAGWRVEFAG